MALLDRLRGWFGRSTPLGAAPATADGGDAAAQAPEGAGSGLLAAERRVIERQSPRAGLRVLVVDDSATIVALLRRMLLQNGFEVLEAGDAETGVALANAQLPDLVFLDIVLPGMNGFAALRQLRRDAATKHIPVIMISGNEQATEEFYLYRIGADDFMKKPFSRAEVFARVARLLDAEGVPRRAAAADPLAAEPVAAEPAEAPPA
jgi:DNA-binding response OmpR family regulator